MEGWEVDRGDEWDKEERERQEGEQSWGGTEFPPCEMFTGKYRPTVRTVELNLTDRPNA